MLRLSLVLILFVGIGAAGCSVFGGGGSVSPQSSQSQSPSAPSAPPVTTLVVVEGQPKVILAPWEIGDNPVITERNFTLAGQIAFLSPQQTLVLYSITNEAPAISLGPSSISMTDDAGRKIQTLAITPLTQLNQLQFGVIVFGPRQPGESQLILHVLPPGGTETLQTVVAKAIIPEPESFFQNGTWTGLYREGYLDQGRYRISFNGWGLDETNRLPGATTPSKLTYQQTLNEAATAEAEHPHKPGVTPTIVAPNPVAVELSGGKPIRTEATLRIEEIQSHQVSFLYVIVLMDWTVKGTLLH